VKAVPKAVGTQNTVSFRKRRESRAWASFWKRWGYGIIGCAVADCRYAVSLGVGMDIWEIDKLFLFIAFVIPGFISLKFYQLMFPGMLRSAADQLVDAIAYSCINYAILLWLMLLVESSKLPDVHLQLYYLFYVFVLFAAPVLWVILWSWMRNWEVFRRNAPHPVDKPWDFVFRQNKEYWMIVYLKNGQAVGGKFSTRSFASSAPAEEQIYLEELWMVQEGVLKRAIKGSAGALISASEISYLELLNYGS
jgi:hypothetical protein